MAASIDSQTPAFHIAQLVADWAHVVDGDDLDRLDRIVAPDGTFSVTGMTPEPLVGLEAIKAFVASFEPRPLQHTCTNVVIDVQPHRASARSKFLCPMPGGTWLLGTYHDEFAQRDGEWRLTARTVTIQPGD
ncbi:MAG: nuclear transport factor 2 family protein [Actinomycetota bacterium]|nr:nuclear transport factor 2 family protein [Actinomycetota bacterium]